MGNLGGLARKGSLARKICKKILKLANHTTNIIRPVTWDCYFEPNFLLLPSIKTKHAVITVHDFSCFRFPQWHPIERVRYMEKYFWKSVNQADHIITVSETIRQEAINTFGINPNTITTIPNGVDHTLFKPESGKGRIALQNIYALPEHFVLYVGTLEPRKNLANLIRAHALLPCALRKRFPLVIVGSQGWNNSEIMSLIQTHAAFTRLIGYVPRAHLPLLYTAATIFAYPSSYEGFGLPVVEAMACGKAILSSTDPALTALSQGAALNAPPEDIEAMAAHMQLLLEDVQLRKNLENKALELASAYSWNDSGLKHMQLFEKIATA